jgi:hypothetical protein
LCAACCGLSQNGLFLGNHKLEPMNGNVVMYDCIRL